MLIEQNIEFELKGPGPLSQTCTPKLGYFHDKSKISEANTCVIIHLIILQEAMYLASSTWPSHFQNLTPKFKILNVLWTWSVSKGKIYHFSFFNWLSNLKILLISNGSKKVRNMIQIVLIKIGIYSKKSFSGRYPYPSLWYVWVKQVCSPSLLTWTVLENFLTFDSSLFPLAKSRLHANPGSDFWSSILRCLCTIKSLFFRKNLITSLRMIFGLALPFNQNSGLRLCIYLVNIFLTFNQFYWKTIIPNLVELQLRSKLLKYLRRKCLPLILQGH